MAAIRFRPGALDLGTARAIHGTRDQIELDGEWRPGVRAARATIDDILATGRTVYGVNTGFGVLARRSVPPDRLKELQVRLVRSHCAGVGPALDDATVRLILALKAHSLARGHSGVREPVIELLLGLANGGVTPVIPAKGSVGASGDLAPLAHMTAVLIGEGEARIAGEVLPGAEALARVGLSPVELAPKEGLALLNGTQVSTALALAALFRAEDLFQAAVVAGAMSVDAARGSGDPFDPRIHDVRGQPGQIQVAEVYRDLLAGSGIRASHVDCDRVQDPYSLRCQPQVMGAVLDQMRHVGAVLMREANAVSDNPLIFAADGDVLSGGNFHAEPVAFAADGLALAVAEIGALAERRVALLVDATLSELPAFLVVDPGINSGFMIAQVTAAALASANKALSHPASVDSLPTSANQEDHVSMATGAALRLAEMIENATGVVAIELLAAAQGIDLLAPLQTSAKLARAHGLIREVAPFYAADRVLAPDIDAVSNLIRSRAFAQLDSRLVIEGT